MWIKDDSNNMFPYKVNKQEKASDQDVTIIITRFTSDCYLELHDTIISGNPFNVSNNLKLLRIFQ